MAREPITRNQADSALDPTLAQKKRARHRLVGAIALCLLAAILIPMILESEPRQAPRDIPLEIDPASRPVPPMAAIPPGEGADAGSAFSASSGSSPSPSPASGQAGPDGAGVDRADQVRSAVRTVDAGAAAAAAAAVAGRADVRAASKTESPAPTRAEPRPDPRPAARVEPRAEAKAEARTDLRLAPKVETPARQAPRPEGDPLAALINRAQDGRPVEAGQKGAEPRRTAPEARKAEVEPKKVDAPARKADNRRFLVQIGAYRNVDGARAISDKVVGSGLRPFQETVKTDKGEWIRVRVGPFDNREAAEKAMRSLKAAGVPAALVAL